MLTVELSAEDMGRVRFAAAPAPLLETVLMLFELRHDLPARSRGNPFGGGPDWREAARQAFASAGRPLLQLAPTRQAPYYLDVLTPDAEEAFHLVQVTPESVHRDNVKRIEANNSAPNPAWLQRYADGDPAVLGDLDRALRAFHAACLAPQWPSVTARFHRDVAERSALMRRHGVIAVLGTLSPDLHLRGMTLEGRCPWDRRVALMGRGLVLMPSAFWTGHPLITWDPQDRSRHVLIYPARRDPGQAFGHGIAPAPGRGPAGPADRRHPGRRAARPAPAPYHHRAGPAHRDQPFLSVWPCRDLARRRPGHQRAPRPGRRPPAQRAGNGAAMARLT